jgi:uncharacterized protein RhaS with RHS repeats
MNFNTPVAAEVKESPSGDGTLRVYVLNCEGKLLSDMNPDGTSGWLYIRDPVTGLVVKELVRGGEEAGTETYYLASGGHVTRFIASNGDVWVYEYDSDDDKIRNIAPDGTITN